MCAAEIPSGKGPVGVNCGRRGRKPLVAHVRFAPDCVAKVFLAFGRETLIQDRTRTSNNDLKEPTPRFDCYKFLFHRACLATFATQSPQKMGQSACQLADSCKFVA